MVRFISDHYRTFLYIEAIVISLAVGVGLFPLAAMSAVAMAGVLLLLTDDEKS